MPLYDVTGTYDKLVDPVDAENYDVLQKASENLNAKRLMKDIRIIDTAIQQAINLANKNNKFVFTKAGFLVGRSSLTPTKDVNHTWESAEIAYPTCGCSKQSEEALAQELQLKWVGGLVRWRISVLPETWLVYRRESGEFNRFTGKEIRISEYWTAPKYVPNFKPIKQKATVADLAAKWGGK